MASSMKEICNIDKLNSNNYAIWKFKLEMMLMKEDLINQITDDPPNPLTGEWTKKDNKARAIINLSLEDSQLIYVKNETSAKATWLALKTIHERANLSSKLYLLRKLYSIKLAENGNMNNHIVKILETADRLKAIGEEIKDSHLSALLLCSLPPSYDTLITALEARSETELNSEFIKGKLTDEFQRRQESSNSSHENVYKTFNKQKQNTRAYPKREQNLFCTNCKRKNHVRQNCWFLKNKNSKNQTSEKYGQNSSLCFEASDFTPETKAEKNTQIQESKSEENQNEKTMSQKQLSLIAHNESKSTWIVDSGSSSHICNDINVFVDIDNNNKNTVTIANGTTLESHGTGTIKLRTQSKDINLKDVLYVPDIQSNLMSVTKATKHGYEFIFANNTCNLSYNGKTLLEGKKRENLYEIDLYKPKQEIYVNFAEQCKNKNCIELWHKRLGHRNVNSIKQLLSNNLATGLEIQNCKHDIICESCIKGKLTNAPYPKQSENRAKKAIDLVHTDVCGPMQTESIGGKKYFLTFTDDYSRFTMIFLLSNKSEVVTKVKEYVAITKNKFGRTVKEIRSDNGGEYTSEELEKFLKYEGIHHQFTIPHCAPQNGVSERKNRTLVEMTRCLLSEAQLPNKFWAEALNTAVYLINRLPTKSHNSTPYQLWTNKKPDLANIKIFGCKAYAYLDKSQRGKLDDKAIKGTFIGYDNRSKGYRIYIGNNKVIRARTVKFIENSNSNENEKKSIDMREELEVQKQPEKAGGDSSKFFIDMQEDKQTDNEENLNENEPRRSQRSNRGVPPDRFSYITKIQKENIEPTEWKDIAKIENPYDRNKWYEATNEEINSLRKNKTWELIDPPPGIKVIGNKWVFTKKYNENNEIEKYKARLVAKGFSQKYGSDYFETFAPVVTYTTIRAFLACAAYKNLDVNHIDIKTAFLHGNLEEEVYMSQPEGHVIPGEENKICKLKKSIYGLKQSARAWNIKLEESLTKLGFVQSTSDPCLFTRKLKNNTTYIIIYVDDLLISGETKEINEIIEQLKKEYEVKNLGFVNYYLGINIKRSKEGNFALDQRNKIKELIEKFDLKEAKPCDTPMEPGYLNIIDEENLLTNNSKYRQAIGTLLYIATITRPDIAAAVNILSRRNEKPREKDWNAVKRVIRYLKTTQELKLIISKENEPILTTYADSDWAGDKNDRKSTTGNLCKLGNTAISWSTKKQNSVALSSAEAEYISAATSAQETVWIINLLKDLDLQQNLPITLFEDNQACINMVKNYKHHSKTKHIDIKYNSIKDLKEKGIIELQYCPTKTMTADILTKPLPKPDFTRHRTFLNLKNIYASEIKQGC